jgi:glycosyltransferase involved in cell wall biosynthesis
MRQSNVGMGGTRNRGYSHCAADSSYVVFLDADDYIEPTMLETLSTYLDDHPDVVLAYCAFQCIDELGNRIERGDPRYTEGRRYVPSARWPQLLPADASDTPFVSIYSDFAGLLPSNSMFRSDAFVQTTGWDESEHELSEDTDMFLRMALLGKVHHIPLPLLRYRRHASQATHSSARIVKRDRRLFDKWSQLSNFDPEVRAVVAEAQRFRERSLWPVLWLQYGVSHLRRGQHLEAAKCLMRAIRQIAMGVAFARWRRHADRRLPAVDFGDIRSKLVHNRRQQMSTVGKLAVTRAIPTEYVSGRNTTLS